MKSQRKCLQYPEPSTQSTFLDFARWFLCSIFVWYVSNIFSFTIGKYVALTSISLCIGVAVILLTISIYKGISKLIKK
jgi:hypothetical protein